MPSRATLRQEVSIAATDASLWRLVGFSVVPGRARLCPRVTTAVAHCIAQWVSGSMRRSVALMASRLVRRCGSSRLGLAVLRPARTHRRRRRARSGTFRDGLGAMPSNHPTSMTATEPVPSADTWTQQLEQLRARYKHVRPPTLAALNVLIFDPQISVDDAKARAALHGVRITAASIGAARTLLERMDSPSTAMAPAATPPTTREPRRPRPPDKGVDAEALVRGFVSKLQAHGTAEGDRLREAMRKAIAVLQAAVG